MRRLFVLARVRDELPLVEDGAYFGVYLSVSPRAASCLVPFSGISALIVAVVKLLSCPTPSRSHGLQPTRLLCPWDSPGKYTGVGCYFLLQGIFLTQGLNPCLLCLPDCRCILYLLNHWGLLIGLT